MHSDVSDHSSVLSSRLISSVGVSARPSCRKRPFSSVVGDSILQTLKSKVESKPLSEFCFVEIFATTGDLCAELRRSGLSASIGIDRVVRRGVQAPLLRMDLATTDGQALLFDILSQPHVIGCHLEPPRNTSSRASALRQRQLGMPQPLRSLKHPDGFPWLEGADKSKIDHANRLFDLVGRVFLFAMRRQLIVSVGNPA